MGLFSKKSTKPEEEAPVTTLECPHTALMPRWDSVDDMGKDDKVVSYRCESCGETFSPEEGRRLMETASNRLPIG